MKQRKKIIAVAGETDIEEGNPKLKTGERLDDLLLNDLFIIQNPERFCFGVDAVLLSDFAKVKKGEVCVDIGTGTGIIPILLSAKTEGRSFYGIELQPEMADMAARSVAYNHLEDRIKIVCSDIRDSREHFPGESVNVITCNPPYMNDDHGLINENESVAIARHELKCTLEDILREASRMLKYHGRMYMIHRPYRMEDVLCTLRQCRLEPKRLRMVHPGRNKEAAMFLVEAVKDGGKSFMKVEPPIIMYE